MFRVSIPNGSGTRNAPLQFFTTYIFNNSQVYEISAQKVKMKLCRKNVKADKRRIWGEEGGATRGNVGEGGNVSFCRVYYLPP